LRRGKEKKLTGGPRLAEKEKERGARGPGWLCVREGKGREGGARAGKELGLGRGPRGEERRGARGGKKRGVLGWVGLLLPFFPFLLFFFFSTLKPFKQIYLNSNKFEFKPYKLNTRKIMLQHECTNMLTL
jgi:hypothetical protein